MSRANSIFGEFRLVAAWRDPHKLDSGCSCYVFLELSRPLIYNIGLEMIIVTDIAIAIDYSN